MLIKLVFPYYFLNSMVTGIHAYVGLPNRNNAPNHDQVITLSA